MWNSESDVEESFRKKVIWASVGIVVLALVAAILYKHFARGPVVPPKADESPHVAPAQTETPPPVHNPIPTSTDTKPLPALNASDPDVHETLGALFGAKTIGQFLVPENIVRHVVVTVDNLPRKKVAADLRPVKPTPGTTLTTSQGDTTTLASKNYERYAPLIKVVQGTDMNTLADSYFKLYPLFQQAYEDLGYPGQYFNDRLVEVIDDLLQTPEGQTPIQVTQPKVFFEYADPKLESRSSGQKLLLRMGPANEAIVKAKLRELRKAVASRADQPVTH